MTALTKIYLKKILRGEKELSEVPPHWRDEVESELAKLKKQGEE